MDISPTHLPLRGLRVLEVKAIGPVPYAGNLLQNLGAHVTVVGRTEPGPFELFHEFMQRGKENRPLDLKSPEDQREFLELVRESDVLIEGMRPGVMERLNIGPDACLEANPELIFARVTGWGQSGDLSNVPGHDINYIGLSGALHAFRRGDGKPVPPQNVVGDFAGGSMHAVISILSAVLGRRAGLDVEQVLDVAMVDGSAALMTMFVNMQSAAPGRLADPFSNAPFYGVYECAEQGTYVAVGAGEDQFFSKLLDVTGIDFPDDGRRWNPASWPELEHLLEAAFRSRTREQWAQLGHANSACLSPVLSYQESLNDPHMRHRIELQKQGAVVGGSVHPSLYTHGALTRG